MTYNALVNCVNKEDFSLTYTEGWIHVTCRAFCFVDLVQGLNIPCVEGDDFAVLFDAGGSDGFGQNNMSLGNYPESVKSGYGSQRSISP